MKELTSRLLASVVIAFSTFAFIFSVAWAAPITPISGGGTQTSTLPGIGSVAGSNGTTFCYVPSSTTGYILEQSSTAPCGLAWIQNTGGGSSGISINGVSSTVYTLNSSTYLGITASGTAFTFTNLGITTTAGNWAGTWQGNNSTTFYLASNPSNFTTTTIQAVLNALSAAGCLTYSTSTGAFTATCVPYTGATGAVNLGSNNFSAAIGNFSGNLNSSGTLFVNPPNGANEQAQYLFNGSTTYFFVLNTGGAGYNPLTPGQANGLFYNANNTVGSAAAKFIIAPWSNVSGGIVLNNLGYLGVEQNIPQFPLDVNGVSHLGGNVDIATSTSLATVTVAGSVYVSQTSTLAATTATDFTDSGVGAGLVLSSSTGHFSAYVGSTCTNQGVSGISATGTVTCTTFATSTNPGTVTTSTPFAANYLTQAASGSSITNSALYAPTASDTSIGTTTDLGLLGIVNASGTSAFTVASTTNNANALTVAGHMGYATSSVSVSSCGTGSPTIKGSDNAGAIVTGSSASSCTVTFAKAWVNPPVCVVSDSNTTAVTDVSSISTSSVTFSMASALSTVNIYYLCEGNPQ